MNSAASFYYQGLAKYKIFLWLPANGSIDIVEAKLQT